MGAPQAPRTDDPQELEKWRILLVAYINSLLGLYLKLDQSTAQNVIGGSPQFDEGLTIKEDKPIYLDGE